MDHGLLLSPKGEIKTLDPNVLILIVMDNGLLRLFGLLRARGQSLNPYCNG